MEETGEEGERERRWSGGIGDAVDEEGVERRRWMISGEVNQVVHSFTS